MLELIQNTLDKNLLSAVSMIANINSSSQSIADITCYAIQYSWTGYSGSSLISTQASNDEIIWTTVDSFVPSGATNNAMVNVEKAGYKFVRVSYTQSSAAGTLTAHINGKVI